MTADVVDLAQYRARRLKKSRYDRLVADLKAGVVFVHPKRAMTHDLVELPTPPLDDDRVLTLRHAFRWEWERSRATEDYRRDLRTLAERQFPHGYEVVREGSVAELRLLAIRSRPRLNRRRRQVRAARRRRRLSRGW